jgi:hypothetical protein
MKYEILVGSIGSFAASGIAGFARSGSKYLGSKYRGLRPLW